MAAFGAVRTVRHGHRTRSFKAPSDRDRVAGFFPIFFFFFLAWFGLAFQTARRRIWSIRTLKSMIPLNGRETKFLYRKLRKLFSINFEFVLVKMNIFVRKSEMFIHCFFLPSSFLGRSTQVDFS